MADAGRARKATGASKAPMKRATAAKKAAPAATTARTPARGATTMESFGSRRSPRASR